MEVGSWEQTREAILALFFCHIKLLKLGSWSLCTYSYNNQRNSKVKAPEKKQTHEFCWFGFFLVGFGWLFFGGFWGLGFFSPKGAGVCLLVTIP